MDETICLQEGYPAFISEGEERAGPFNCGRKEASAFQSLSVYGEDIALIVNYYLKNCLASRDRRLCQEQPGRRRSHFFNSFFLQNMFDEYNENHDMRGQYAYSNVSRWSSQVSGKDIFELKYIVCPYNYDITHWALAVIFMEEKRIQWYDSAPGIIRKATVKRNLDGLMQYLQDEYKEKKRQEFDVSAWNVVLGTRNTPRQLNGKSTVMFIVLSQMQLSCLPQYHHSYTGHDCGVFTCIFSDFISKDAPPIFTQNHIDQCRKRIALSIIKNCAVL